MDETQETKDQVFTAPYLLATAVFLFALAIVEKGLNLIGARIPILDVFPRQLLEWAIFLLILDIALLLRQMVENRL
ncbi:MAG TPA: hypothetical protein VMM79_11620 [Longimicrobiales bacterium]|nr:hypothetical protein [Longimicrobiales bacterium]